MILAFDTYYYSGKAKTVCLVFEKWTDKEPVKTYSEILNKVEEYKSGEFYKRELPCILSLLSAIKLIEIEAIVVDGFVVLNDDGKPGLGCYLYRQLGCAVPIIGVAKNDFVTIKNNKRELFRGNSSKPLYITALGINIDEATEHIKTMSGNYRIPTLLKQLDQLTKEKTIANTDANKSGVNLPASKHFGRHAS